MAEVSVTMVFIAIHLCRLAVLQRFQCEILRTLINWFQTKSYKS
jgi:hypothetical protein